jgi:tRNA threonylcarbamoyl adenosine modification protein YeaZ
VAVLEGQTILAEQAEAAGETIPPLRLIGQALQAAGVESKQVECVAVGLGPGSYTGIRGAIALAQGWQLAGSVKLIGVGSVDCLAAQARAENRVGRINVVVDAQRGELYLAVFAITADAVRELVPLRIVTLTEARSAVGPEGRVVGPEVGRWFPDGRELFPAATALGRLAAVRNDFVSGERLEPVYLRTTSFVKAPSVRALR